MHGWPVVAHGIDYPGTPSATAAQRGMGNRCITETSDRALRPGFLLPIYFPSGRTASSSAACAAVLVRLTIVMTKWFRKSRCPADEHSPSARCASRMEPSMY
jgi:hypothetical protein